MSEYETEKNKDKRIELGDIILIDVPTNPEWHQHIFFIAYIDDEIVEMIHTQTSFSYIWNWKDTTDIKKISVLERSSIKGFAKQNGLYPHIWIDIYFGGETPRSITAEITNLEEDMIELTTYPENQVLYIDFAYQGVPRNIPIEKICIREKPSSFRRGVFSQTEDEGTEDETNASIEYLENGYISIVLPKQFQADENYHDRLQKMYLQEEGEELEEITQQLEIPPEQQHFGLEAQVNDLLDAFLSTIPDYKRTPSVMKIIYTHIQRFKELREKFSIFDDVYHQIIGIKRPFEKPIVEKIANLEISLPWFIPIVSQIKKIYYDDDEKDGGPYLSKPDEDKEPELIQINLEDEFSEESKVEDDLFYKNNIPQNVVKYANMYIDTANYECTFENYPEFALNTSKVNADMDVITSIDPTLNSKTIGNGGIYTKRFAFQRYNKEIVYPKSRGKENASFATLFPADNLSFRSLFLMPETFIPFSKIKLPNTSILHKSALNTVYPYYFNYLNKRTKTIDTEITLDNDDNKPTVNKSFQHLHLSSNDEVAESMDPKDKLKSFLNESIPSISTIVETYLKKQKYVFSFLQAVDILEPFFIYIDDITWKIANVIKQLLYKNIDRYNTESALKSELFKALLLEKYKTELLVNTKLFLGEDNNKKDFEKILENYDTKNEMFLSSSEWIEYLLNYDQGRFYWNYMKNIQLDLYIPEFLLPELEGNDEDDKKCWKRVIAKKYKNFNDLKEDNNKPIFFDKDLDTTNYSLVENYEKTDEKEFIDYWSQTLSAKYGYTMEHALAEATILWDGNKKVLDGDYAIFEQIPNLPNDIDSLSVEEQKEIQLESDVKKRVMYFIRKKNKWEHEADLDEYSFLPTNDLLCTIDPKCMSQKDVCTSKTERLNQFKLLDREKIRKEFESRYDISKEDLSQKFENENIYHTEWMEQEKKIRLSNQFFYDYKAYEYGKRAVLQEFIESPYVSLRNNILQNNLDFVTKQNYIVLFVEKFCREPMLEEPMKESEHWKYCKETNTKLMPTSLYRLANAYLEDLPLTNNIPVKYNAVLNQLRNTVGKLSDDGDAYIDKYSGYILQKIEMREEGFEMNYGGDENNGELFQDNENKFEMGEVIVKQIRKNEVVKIYKNEIDQRVYNIITTICRNIYVNGEENKELMMQLALQMLKIPKFFTSETNYKAQVNMIMKKREQDPKIKIPDSYEVYMKKKHIIIATLSVLITVQTSIPEISIDRTFPGCVKSFDGYPLKEGQDDLSSIHYFACVLKKMYASKENNSLIPKGKGELETILLKTLKDSILLQPYIVNLYDIKRIYLLENPILHSIPRELEMDQKWPHFLPPIYPFSIPAKMIQTISSNGQTTLNIFQVKMRTCTLAIVQYIREMVSKKNILFQTKSGFPFLQNACCDEVLQFPPKSFLEYFYEDAEIERIVKILSKMSLTVRLMNQKTKAWTVHKESGSTFFNETDIEKEKDKDKENKKRNIFYSFEPILYYATLIHYCKLDFDIYPIPVEFERFCSKKPAELSEDKYDTKSSTLEKMHFLEKHNIRMDVEKTISMMNIVNQRNTIEIINNIDISYREKLNSSIENFRDLNQDIPSLVSFIAILLNSQENPNFNYKNENISLKNQILSFIGRNATEKPTLNALTVIAKPLYVYNIEIPITNLANHMKSLVYRFGIIYPCFLQKESVRKKIPTYWELLPNDTYFLTTHIQTYRELLNTFVNNPLILPIFENSVERIKPLFEFMEYAFLTIESKNSQQYFELALFIIHGIFLLWIGLIDNNDIYKTITRSLRENLETEGNENRIRSESNSQLLLDQDDDILEEVDITSIQIEQKEEIQQCLADLFIVMFSTIQTKKQINSKEPVMMSYADIMREVDYSRDREKQRLKNKFKTLSIDERKAENVLKKLHLGDFAVDMKKINKYGKTDLLGDRDEDEDESEDLAISMDIAEQETEEFLETRDGDSNLEDQGEEEDQEDMNEYAYDNYVDNDD
jgi:hypothetical protein